jgi:hypothetical protein
MKNFIKSLIVTTALLFSFKAEAQEYWSTNNVAAGFQTVAEGALVLNSVTAFTTNTAATILRVYDGWVVSTNALYTNYVTFPTNVVTSYINTGGTTNLLTNTVQWVAAQIVAASTNTVPKPIAMLVIPGSRTANVNGDPLTVNYATGTGYQNGLAFGRRLAISNDSAGTTIIVNYRRP